MENLQLWALSTVFVFALLNEAIIEYMFGNIVLLRPFLPLLGLALSILITFMYQINIVSLILGVQTNTPFLDILFTAFIIARLSNLINDFVRKVIGSK